MSPLIMLSGRLQRICSFSHVFLITEFDFSDFFSDSPILSACCTVGTCIPVLQIVECYCMKLGCQWQVAVGYATSVYEHACGQYIGAEQTGGEARMEGERMRQELGCGWQEPGCVEEEKRVVSSSRGSANILSSFLTSIQVILQLFKHVSILQLTIWKPSPYGNLSKLHLANIRLKFRSEQVHSFRGWCPGTHLQRCCPHTCYHSQRHSEGWGGRKSSLPGFSQNP